MGAHTVLTAIRWPIIAVTELLRIDVVVLGYQGGWWCHIGDFIDQTDDVITVWSNCFKN